MTENEFVSVIIPVYRSLPVLVTCLEALEKQSYAPYEVIVVDNGGNEGIEKVCSGYPNVRLHHHHEPGSYSARNAGIRIAKGEILVFTDADCVPVPDWLRNGVSGMLSASCRMGSGCIRPRFLHEHQPGIIELCDVILHTMDQEQSLKEVTSVACANMFVHRLLIDSVGMFNDALYSAGDCEFTFRVREQGEHITYIENAVVHHFARRTLGELAQRYRRFAGSEFMAMTMKNSSAKKLRSLSFPYRVMLCFRNISAGVKKYAGRKNPVILFGALLAVESCITVIKLLEYIRLSFGAEKQR